MALGELVIREGERRTEHSRRKKKHDEKTILAESWERHEQDGWTLVRTNKSGSLRIRSTKAHDEVLENRFWNVLYGFGYEELNKGRNFKIQLDDDQGAIQKQIDVFAKDDETVIVAECKSCSFPRKRSMQKDLGEFASLKGKIASAVRKHYGTHFRPKILWFFVTHNVRWTESDLSRAKQDNIHVMQSKELIYFEEISRKLGKSAKYQFHAEYLSTQKVPALANRKVPAVKTKVSGKTAYFFSALPVDILRIAFVNHRDLRDPGGAPAYQRLVSPRRLREIGGFLDKGGFFPNTILLNFHRKPQFNYNKKDPVSDIQFGELVLPDRYKSCWVIDGQHRLYGTTFARKQGGDSPLFFIAFEGIDQAEEAETFITINAKQTKVPKKLLSELDGEVKWNSPDIKERLAAIASRCVDLLNSEGAGPLEDKISTPGVSANPDQPLTLPSFQAAILQSKLLGYINSRNGEFVSGPCWDKDSAGSLTRLQTLLSWYFDQIEQLNPDRWSRGKDGYLCSNFGIAGHIRLIGEIIPHIERSENRTAAEAEIDELQEWLERYLQPAWKFIKEADDNSFVSKFKVPFGSGGAPRYFYRLVELVRTQHPAFEPEGYEEFIQTISNAEVDRADRQVKWIQKEVSEFVVSALRSKFGEKFFELGVPKQIQKSCQERRIDDHVDKQLPVETYLDWMHVKKIAEQKELKEEFRDALSIKLDDEPDGRHLYFGWFDKVNEIRRIAAHPAGRHYQKSDVALLDEIVKQLQEKLASTFEEGSYAAVS